MTSSPNRAGEVEMLAWVDRLGDLVVFPVGMPAPMSRYCRMRCPVR